MTTGHRGTAECISIQNMNIIHMVTRVSDFGVGCVTVTTNRIVSIERWRMKASPTLLRFPYFDLKISSFSSSSFHGCSPSRSSWTFPLRFNIRNSSNTKTVVSISTTKRRRHTGTDNNYNKKLGCKNISRTKINYKPVVDDNYLEIRGKQVDRTEDRPVNLRSLSQNGDPLGRKDLGKSMVKWISQGMKAMTIDFGEAVL
ncbi:unnamed protein product [Lactuca virosa]|uniref:Uncharacterized protein n=1 Tax=Lactuca virosa TaxID=75947 RepID=A0AAU9NU30_9ASTR|nr:unnamed protein product [Lactuca virosa]